ncbi:interferon-gamma-inducible GTPase 10-like [Ruditapes philippinarum]|uniref:interferon-gamma-inducible GTPase 10-like n=1 Tax=Ruditapes philippinarum TaxID=129788 RepID=UPI00295AA088|nr:interferon-gamma-inducible GTPase 10-like [Ruditapes philippinarum]XP_060584626.1 interferon-gamma-inducible GTPase 10-like [Ruditapes philippinarum]XP_060584628.1 interferon-gamma-inducible GTPase 10-like [Ruditapes philippinarum]XP_060584629.1 interferon-gamma-inducible GTPase 10-like [Ruditapes philippinarum]
MMASNSTFECNNIPAEEGELFVDEFNKHGIAGIQQYVTERLNKWRRIPLHIAVTGKAGAGKSTFINVIRGLKTGEAGAAHTDVTEGTKTIKSYKHPYSENIVFWDLPGVGTENFKRENYDDKVKLAKYDFFLIFSSERFLENDGWLAKEIRKMDKRFYFVRTKVFLDISNEAKGRAFPRSRDDILSHILIDCLQNLEGYGISDSPVYLIDNFEPYDFDFGRLQAKLIEDAPQLKREALAFSIIGQTQEIMLQKKKELEKRIPIISLASAVAGAVPIPGFGTAVDAGLMIKEIMFYREQFGLTEDAIKKSAVMLGVRTEELKSQLDMKELFINCTKKGVLALCNAFLISQAAEEATKFVLPVIGSAIAGILSYKSTSYCMTKILEGMYEDALKINMKLSMYLAQSSSV